MQTITRKFLVKSVPDLSNLSVTQYNRFYLYNANGVVVRVQSVGGKYELERKADKSELVRNEQKIEITKDEFEVLSKLTDKNILRDSYLISENAKMTLRVYHGKIEGLARAEVSFKSVEEAQNYKPLDWFENEVTNSPLAKDGELLNLSKEEFEELLNKF